MAQEKSSSDLPAAEAELSRTGSARGLNAKAPEFVPRVPERVVVRPIHHHPHPHAHPIHVFHAGPPGAAFFATGPPPPQQFEYYTGFVEQEVVAGAGEQDPVQAVQAAGKEGRDSFSDDVVHKITKQVEYYFSDINLATTEHLIRFITKDPEGFVPMNIIAGFKKIKALVNNNAQLASALRSSTKLVVSEDGKKVKRVVPFTESDMDELQSRIVVAENLPEDHCYQNLMKLFSAVGSVKTIRTCYPQTPTGTGPVTNRSAKLDMLFANKLHAFVEYETIEDAEKAINELNDERNWRSGLRVRLLQVCMKSGGRKKGEANGEEEDGSGSPNPPSNEKLPHQLLDESSPTPEPSHHEQHPTEESSNSNSTEKDHTTTTTNGRGRGNNNNKSNRGGRGNNNNNKSRGRGPHTNHNNYHYHNNNNNTNTNNHNHRSSNNTTPPPIHSPTAHLGGDHPLGAPKQPPGPRMPDGTRGFALGRGKPLTPPPC
ncbi:hypothetical protein LUZ60_007621 [Juncus effusus]|nr:hypothetical protein LUZ60_007621 [Juncus effusus]